MNRGVAAAVAVMLSGLSGLAACAVSDAVVLTAEQVVEIARQASTRSMSEAAAGSTMASLEGQENAQAMSAPYQGGGRIARVVDSDVSQGAASVPDMPNTSDGQQPTQQQRKVEAVSPEQGSLSGPVPSGVGRTVESGPVQVTFSGAGLAPSTQVTVDEFDGNPLASPRAAGRRSVMPDDGLASTGTQQGPMGEQLAASGLPVGAVLVADPFEVTATGDDGEQVTHFPTTFDTQMRDGVQRAVNVVPGVSLDVEVSAERVDHLDVASVRLYTRESDANQWTLLPSFFDADNLLVHGESDHLSQFVVIGTPFVPAPGPRVVLDPDNDIAHATWPQGVITELPLNVALASGVASKMASDCGATVVVTRDASAPVVSQETRAGIARAAHPALMMTLAFNAAVGHAWGDEWSDGGSQIYPRPGSEGVAQSLVNELPTYTDRPAKIVTSPSIPYDDFYSLPGAVVHSETLYLDNNWDWPVISNGMPHIVNGVYVGAGKWLESQGFDCIDRVTGGWPAPPSAALKARWRQLGWNSYQTYGAEPVNMVTGNLIENFDLFEVSGAGGQSTAVGLTYNALDGRESRFGFSWVSSLGAQAQRFDDGSVMVVRGDGTSFMFTSAGGGRFSGEAGTGTLVLGSDGRVTWTDTDGGVWLFATEDIEGIGELARYTSVDGKTLTFSYGAPSGSMGFVPLVSVADSAGQVIRFAADSRGRVSSVTSPDGRAWRLGYSGAGDLTSITDPAGGVQRFTYDASHRMVTASDPANVIYLRNTFDSSGRVVSQQDAAGNTRRFAYAASGGGTVTTYTDNLGRQHRFSANSSAQLTAVTAPDGSVQRFTYDGWGNTTSFTDEAGARTTYGYDSAGNLISKDGPQGLRGWTYDGRHNVTAQTVPDGQAGAKRTTAYQVTAAGFVQRFTDAAGQVTVSAFDAAGNATAVTGPTGAVTRYGYDGRGNITSIADPTGAVTAVVYDAANRPVRVTNADGQVTAYAWDVLDRLVSIISPDGGITRYGYDATGNLLSVTAPDGSVTRYGWDVLFHLTSATDPLGRVTRYAYDGEDNLTSVTDPAGNIIRYSYDLRDRLVESIDAEGGVSAYTYDGVGNLLSETTPGGGRTTYTYTAAGLVESITDPLGATWGYGYDAAWRLVAAVDPLGNVTRFTYDVLDRVTRVSDPAGEITTYTYDAAGNLTSSTDRLGNSTVFAFDAAGRMIESRDAAGAVTAYAYTPGGALSEIADPLGATTQVTYDAAGRITEKKSPLGAAWEYGYDAAGHLTSAVNPLGATTQRVVDTAGQLVTETDPTGLSTTFTYDQAGRVETMTAPDGLVTRYTYDGRGNLLTATLNPTSVDAQAGVDKNVTWAYAWDADSNLASVTDPGGVITRYSYDLAGNLLSTLLPTGGALSQVYDAAGQVVETRDPRGVVTAYSYDTRGDVASARSGSTQVDYVYDAEQQLIAMTDPLGATGWGYDATGRPIWQFDSQGRWLGYGYDAAGQLLTQTLLTGVDSRRAENLASTGPTSRDIGGALLAQAFTYDADGRPNAQTATITPATRSGLAQASGQGVSRTFSATYTWDAASRVTSIGRSNPDGNPAITSTFARDAAGRTTAIAHLTPDPNASMPANPPAEIQPPSSATAAQTSFLSNKPALILPAGQDTVGSAPARLALTGDNDGTTRGSPPSCPHAVPVSGAATYLGNRLTPATVDCTNTADYLANRTLPGVAPVAANGNGLRVDYTYTGGHVATMTRTTGAVSAALAAGDSEQTNSGGGSAGGSVPAVPVAFTVTTAAPMPSAVDLDSGEPVASRATAYAYDGLGRVIEAVTDNGSRETFTWDKASNRTSWTTSDNPQTPAAADALAVTWSLNAAGLPEKATLNSANGVSTASYSWDATGARQAVTVTGDTHLAGLWGQHHSWDTNGKHAGTSTNDHSTSHGFDGLGRRSTTATTASMEAFTTSTVFDGPVPLAAQHVGAGHAQSTGDDWDVWVRDMLGGQLLQTATGLAGTLDGDASWMLLDNLGSIIATGPASGSNAATITQIADYSTFGIANPQTQGWNSANGYTGQSADLALGQVAFAHRTLDPVTGGWTSPDTWEGLLAVPQSLNKHAYVIGDPASLIDADGMLYIRPPNGTPITVAKLKADNLKKATIPAKIFGPPQPPIFGPPVPKNSLVKPSLGAPPFGTTATTTAGKALKAAAVRINQAAKYQCNTPPRHGNSFTGDIKNIRSSLKAWEEGNPWGWRSSRDYGIGLAGVFNIVYGGLKVGVGLSEFLLGSAASSTGVFAIIGIPGAIQGAATAVFGALRWGRGVQQVFQATMVPCTQNCGMGGNSYRFVMGITPSGFLDTVLLRPLNINPLINEYSIFDILGGF